MKAVFFVLLALPLQAAVSLQSTEPQWVQENGKRTAVYEFDETDISLYGAWEPDAAAVAVRFNWQQDSGEAKWKGAGTLDLKGGTLTVTGTATFSVAAGVSITNAAVTLSGGATFAPASGLVPTALSWSGSGNTWSGDLSLAETCVLIPDAEAPLTINGTLTLNGSFAAEGDWETLFLCQAVTGDVATWSNGRYEAVTLEGGITALQRVQQQGGNQGSGSGSGEQGGSQGSGSESGEQGSGQGSGSDNSQGSGSSSAAQGTLLTHNGGAFGEEDLRIEGNTTLTAGFSWTADDEHKLRGQGTVDLGGGLFRAAGGMFTVANGVSFRNGTAEVAAGAALLAQGASLAGVSLHWNGGTIVTECYELSAGRSIVSRAQGVGGIVNTLAGDLTLNGGTLYLQGDATQNLPYHGAALAVTGRAALQSATQIIFTLPNAAHYTEVQSIYPAAGTPILTCGQWLGDVSLLSAAALWQGTVIPVTALYFETQTLSSGETALILKMRPGSLGNKIDEEKGLFITPHERVDLSAVQHELSNRLIRGTGGTILTTPLQTLRLPGTDTILYSVEAADGCAHAADLRIGHADVQDEETHITLSGALYDTALTEVLNGTLNISPTTALGHDATTQLKLRNGALNNSGTIRGAVAMSPYSRFNNNGMVEGDVTMAPFSVLQNAGCIGGQLTIGADALAQGGGQYQATRVCRGGTLDIGNGQRQEALTLEEGAQLLFPQIGQADAPLSVGMLRAEGRAEAAITVSPALLPASLRPVTYSLIHAEQAEGSPTPFRLTAQDETNGLLGSMLEQWDGRALTVRLRVRDSVATAALASAAAGVASTRYAAADLLGAAADTARHAPQLPAHGTALHGGAFGGQRQWGTAHATRHQYSGVYAGAERGLTDALTAGLHLAAARSDFRTAPLRSKGSGAFVTATARAAKPLNKHWSLLADAYLAGGQMRQRADIIPQARLSMSGLGHETMGVFGGGAELTLQRRREHGFTVAPFVGLHAVNARSGRFTERKEDGAEWQYTAATLQQQRAEAGMRLQKQYPVGAEFTLTPALEIARSTALHRSNGTTTATAYGYSGGSCGTAPSSQVWRAEAAFTLRATAGYSLQLRGGAETDHEHRAYHAAAEVLAEF